MNQFGTPEKYFKACDRLSQSGYEVRLYQSPEVAAYDLVQSLIHFAPHKNKIAVISQGSHLIDVVTSLTLKNQNQIVYKKDQENTIAFLESLPSSIHFVFWSSENEITGEVLYNESQCEEIRTVLNRKKIFSFQTTCRPTVNSHLFSSDTASYVIVLQSPTIFKLNKEATLVYFSEKQKISFGLAPIQEMSRASSFINLTPATSSFMDRVLVNCEHALQIKEYLNLSDAEAFVAQQYPSWVTDKWVQWWPEVAQASILKGLLVLSSEYTKDHPDYVEKIKEAEAKIKQLSSWKI